MSKSKPNNELLHRVIDRLSRVHLRMAREQIPHQAVGFDIEELDAMAQAGRNWERVEDVLALLEFGEPSVEIVMDEKNKALQTVFTQMGMTYTRQHKFPNGMYTYLVRRANQQ